MDAKQIRRLKPMLMRYLKRFDDCFARKDTGAHLSVYVEGQLSDLNGKNVEAIAKRARVPAAAAFASSGSCLMKDTEENPRFCGLWTVDGSVSSARYPGRLPAGSTRPG